MILPPTLISLLSLHAALPISGHRRPPADEQAPGRLAARGRPAGRVGVRRRGRPGASPPAPPPPHRPRRPVRSEEHTSELQSPCNLVCRLLLEKKKKTQIENEY